MTITRLGDVIQPEVFTDYVVQRTMELSALIQSGIAENNAEFDALASAPNKLIHMPYWNDLQGDDEVMLDSGDATPGEITAGEDVARKLGRVKAFGANGLSAYLSGDDPMAAIGDRLAAYWARVYQKILISTLEGAFASTGGNPSMADKVLDITSEDDPLLSGETFLDALQLMGDAKDLLTGVMMHSAVETYLAKRKLIEYVQESEQNPRVPYFMNKRVIVDDGMIYDGDTKEGVMYLFGSGAIAWGNGTHPNILQTELVRNGLSYSGEDVLMSRRIAILHPRGVKWLETNLREDPSQPADSTNPTLPFPNNAALEVGDNWQLEYEPKAVRIVKFVFSVDDSANGEE
jgi:hypothetical protein